MGELASVVLKGEVVPTDGTTPDGVTPNVTADTSTGIPRPAWLPEKFANAEAMATAYAELEAKQGTQTVKPKVDAAGQPVKLEVDKTAADAGGKGDIVKPYEFDEGANAMLASKGIDGPALAQEMVANDGKLADASYAKLEAAGYPRSMVDAWIEGQRANAGATAANAKTTAELAATQASITSIKESVGGEAKFAEMVTWVGKLPDADIDAYNKAVDNPNPEIVKLAVQGMNARFVAANGLDPSLMIGGGIRPGLDVFASHAEHATANTAARASGDPAAIQAVQEKALRSPAL